MEGGGGVLLRVGLHQSFTVILLYYINFNVNINIIHICVLILFSMCTLLFRH